MNLKIINLIKMLADTLKSFHSKYNVNATDFASQLPDEVKQVCKNKKKNSQASIIGKSRWKREREI